MRLLLNKTPEWAIKLRPGPGGTYKYVPHGYVTDQLNKLFGFDWDLVIDPMADGKMFALELEEVPVYKMVKGQRVVERTDIKRHVSVIGHIICRVHDKSGEVTSTLQKSGFGSQLWLPGAEFGDALKGATSDMLKVCAHRLGVALDLYWSEDKALEAYEAKARSTDEVIDAEVEQLTNQVPTTLPVLLSRASTEHGMPLAEIEKLAKAKVGELMTWDAGKLEKLWKKVLEEAEKLNSSTGG